MKARLLFDLEEPDDRTAHLRCIKALDMALCLSDIREVMVKMWESCDEKDPWEDAEGHPTLHGFYRKLKEAYDDYDISTDNLLR